MQTPPCGFADSTVDPGCGRVLSMGNTIKALRRGIKAGVESMAHPTHSRFEAGGKRVVCSHCGNTTFDWVGVLGISHAGYGIQCSNCTHLEYLGNRPREVG